MQEDQQARQVQQLWKLARESERKTGIHYADLHVAALPATKGAMAYFEFGDPTGTPLLCLHGLSLSGFYFAQYHDAFAELGVRVIAPCMLGGIYLEDPAKTIEDLTWEIVELLDVLGIEQFDVLGISWGTLPQLSLLARVPERIGRSGFVGAMPPLAFVDGQVIGQLKSDIRTTLKMVARSPGFHRALMWLVCRLPVATLVGQFKDDTLSAAETDALVPGRPFHTHFARCMSECLSTGSQFFTQAWRMFLDEPRYALGELAAAVAQVDVRFYVAEQDNVHLPYFSALEAAACMGRDVNEVQEAMSQARSKRRAGGTGIFQLDVARGNCSVWSIDGAGRMACVLYFKEALANLLAPVPASGAPAGPARREAATVDA
jgi:pimeloyl-ACP methyl ester carboxylesterase